MPIHWWRDLNEQYMHLNGYYSGKKRKLQHMITCRLWSYYIKLNNLITEVHLSIPLTWYVCLVNSSAMYNLDHSALNIKAS